MLKLFFLYVFLFLLCLILGVYIYYLYKYPKPHDKNYLLKYYPKDIILKTGGRLTTPNRPEERIQHFLNFSPTKKPGVIRVGVFGDSHTFGAEVDKTETYPYQLQGLLNQRFPNKKIEVLNFGINSNGFQEQFLLWEKYSKSYGLDYILLGPRSFYPYREVTFRHHWILEAPMYPRERFILSPPPPPCKIYKRRYNKQVFKYERLKKDECIKRVHIKGDTLEERYKNNYTLIPSWTALRYSKRPFLIWEIFFPFFKT